MPRWGLENGSLSASCMDGVEEGMPAICRSWRCRKHNFAVPLPAPVVPCAGMLCRTIRNAFAQPLASAGNKMATMPLPSGMMRSWEYSDR